MPSDAVQVTISAPAALADLDTAERARVLLVADAPLLLHPGRIGRLEGRGDRKVSTLRRVVEALGGEVEIVVTLGRKRVRLAA